MAIYRRKETKAPAVQFLRETWKEALEAQKMKEPLNEEQLLLCAVFHEASRGFRLETPRGTVKVALGDYLTLNPNGEIINVPRTTFEELYELVDGVRLGEGGDPEQATPVGTSTATTGKGQASKPLVNPLRQDSKSDDKKEIDQDQ